MNTEDKAIKEMAAKLAEVPVIKKDLAFMEATACLSGRTKAEQRKKNRDYLETCAKLIVINPAIAQEKIIKWWFCNGRKPRNLKLASQQ